MKGYVFIGNSTKPTVTQQESLDDVKLTYVSLLPIQCASEHGYKLFAGINRTYAEKLRCLDNLDIHFYNQHTYRSIFALRDNWVAFKNLRSLLKKHPEIEFIHCNTPIGGLIGRICGKIYGVKTIVYTAHGFHFYKGAPFFNRTIIKWIERLLAYWTDAILTMNKEDFESASKFCLRNGGKVYHIPGVGVDSNGFTGVDFNKEYIRDSLNIPQDSVMAIAMGDVVPRKNYKIAIEAVAKANRSQLHYVICGKGDQIEILRKYAKELHIEDQIHFLGFRNDIKELALSSDLFLFSSLQEGLPRSTMEAMCAGLPCVISEIRGHVDLIENEHGGLLCPVNDVEAFAASLQRMVDNPDFRKEQGSIAKERIKKFDVEIVRTRLREIYADILSNSKN